MSDRSALTMADILPPAPAAGSDLGWPWLLLILVLLILVLLGLLLLALWRARNSKIRTLKRRLQQDRLKPREACHLLAATLQGTEAQAVVNRLRFRRVEPEKSEVLELLSRVGSDE